MIKISFKPATLINKAE